MSKFSGPIESPTDSQSKDGVPTPCSQTVPAGAAGKGDSNPNKSK